MLHIQLDWYQTVQPEAIWLHHRFSLRTFAEFDVIWLDIIITSRSFQKSVIFWNFLFKKILRKISIMRVAIVSKLFFCLVVWIFLMWLQFASRVFEKVVVVLGVYRFSVNYGTWFSFGMLPQDDMKKLKSRNV